MTLWHVSSGDLPIRHTLSCSMTGWQAMVRRGDRPHLTGPLAVPLRLERSDDPPPTVVLWERGRHRGGGSHRERGDSGDGSRWGVLWGRHTLLPWFTISNEIGLGRVAAGARAAVVWADGRLAANVRMGVERAHRAGGWSGGEKQAGHQSRWRTACTPPSGPAPVLVLVFEGVNCKRSGEDFTSYKGQKALIREKDLVAERACG